MKFLSFYKDILNSNTEDQVFDFLISNLKPSDTLWSYFVNWEKVFTFCKRNRAKNTYHKQENQKSC